MTDVSHQLRNIISRLDYFTAAFGHVQLRPYQVEAADAVIQSVLNKDGETFVWKFARQSGKDETLTAMYQYLLTVLGHRDISIIAAAPTFRPQLTLAMQRLDTRLSRNLALRKSWRRSNLHSFRLRSANLTFLSASPNANVVGATAWPLLVMNEAQDILPVVYDKRFAPMAAANNATRLFSGTAWTRDTLLAREERLCRQKEQQDGRRRVFVVDGQQVAEVHPPYGKFLESEIARLGANHPIVISQYLCREIDNEVGMFNEGRRALIFANPVSAIPQDSLNTDGPDNPSDKNVHLRSSLVPTAFLLDVAGQDENRLHDPASTLDNPGRDAVTLRIVQIDLSTLGTLQAPTYRVVHSLQWIGQNHLTVFGQLKALGETWHPQHIVIDATGVGEGLWAMLDKQFRDRVIPVKFNSEIKSEIGYRFLAIIETGRFRDLSAQPSTIGSTPSSVLPSPLNDGNGSMAGETTARHLGEAGGGSSPGIARVPSPSEVYKQYSACQAEVLIGPRRTMRWGVPEGARDADGQLIHDDILMADCLVSKLDELKWSIRFKTIVIPAKDPLEEMSHFREY